MTRSQERKSSAQQAYEDQLAYAREQARIWAHLSLEARHEQMHAHVESEFGYVAPCVLGDALALEDML
jgi:hypothetical protein